MAQIDWKEKLEVLQEQLQDFDVNDLSLEAIGTWPLVVKIISWALAFVVAIVLGYQFLISDLIRENASAEAKEIQLKESFKKKAYMEESFGALVSQLPSETEVPGLLEDITNKGSVSGLIIDKIDLQPEISEAFYVKLPIEIVVRGAYHNLGAFVSGVASLPRIVTLTDFKVSPKKGEGGRHDASNLEMVITANTYRYKPEVKGKKRKTERK